MLPEGVLLLASDEHRQRNRLSSPSSSVGALPPRICSRHYGTSQEIFRSNSTECVTVPCQQESRIGCHLMHPHTNSQLSPGRKCLLPHRTISLERMKFSPPTICCGYWHGVSRQFVELLSNRETDRGVPAWWRAEPRSPTSYS